MTGFAIFLCLLTPALILACLVALAHQRERLGELEREVRYIRCELARRDHSVYTKRLFNYAERGREGVRDGEDR